MQDTNFFTINGYWKDDKTKIEGALISVEMPRKSANDIQYDTETNGVKDEGIFYYGLDESDIKRIIEQGEENDQVDFVITDYSPA